ncbi:MAG: hypothetical protein NTW87_04050 [Planctomycetota bacterium]|nr:hypothetical protein [Planctomycetota bacterium]
MTNPFACAELDARSRHAPFLLLTEHERVGELARLVLERAEALVRDVSSLKEAERALAGFAPEVLLVGWMPPLAAAW